MNQKIAWIITVGLVFTAVSVTRVDADQCSDYDTCTINDMCLPDGECSGTPLTGPTCDDHNECTVNDVCTNGVCRGTPVADGSTCGKGCGKCMFGGLCVNDPQRDGFPCVDDLGSCTTNDRCMYGFCFGDFVECPDLDGNPCTMELCMPDTGNCMQFDFPPCSECESCRVTGSGPEGYTCDDLSDDTPCDDYNVCTGNGSCYEGMCESGPPQTPNTTPKPTGTNTPGTIPTPTRTEVVPPTWTRTAAATTTRTIAGTPTRTRTPGGPSCVGDCNGNESVSVDELIVGVRIALGMAGIEDCPAFDSNGDLTVMINELVEAVTKALGGCGIL